MSKQSNMDEPMPPAVEELRARLQQMKSEHPEEYLQLLMQIKEQQDAFSVLLSEVEKESGV